MNAAAQIALLVYGVLLIIGGIIGYVKAGSKPSLIAGVVSGVIALALWYAGEVGCIFAPDLALVLAIVLFLMMGKRFATTKKMMPSGLIVILSLIVAVLEVAVLAGFGG